MQSKGLSSVFSNTQFKSINSLALSFLYSPTLTSIHDYWKNQSFDYIDLCCRLTDKLAQANFQKLGNWGNSKGGVLLKSQEKTVNPITRGLGGGDPQLSSSLPKAASELHLRTFFFVLLSLKEIYGGFEQNRDKIRYE